LLLQHLLHVQGGQFVPESPGQFAPELVVSLPRNQVVWFIRISSLTLSEEKTRITHIEDGFDFLGFTIRKYEGKFLIKPSKEKLKKFSEKVAGIIDANKTSKQDSLIRLLNPVITGWANYYKGCNASDTFRKADYLIFQKLWAWALRRHPKKGRYWIANKYFRTIKNQNWRFAVDTAYKGKDDVFVLKKLYDTKIVRYVMIKQDANPFDPEWNAYFKRRETYKMLETFQGKKPVLYIWKRQKGVCPICGEIIGRELPWGTTDYLVNGLMQRTLVHDACRRSNDQLKLKLS
jgi:RNA-directed DNA polymerase